MSTNSFSVIGAIEGALQKYFIDPDLDLDSIRPHQPTANRMQLRYASKDYDITVTKLIPGCGETMDFGQAVRCLKAGMKVAREGWNGKGMYIFLADEGGDFHTKAEIGPERKTCVHPFIVMYTAQGDFQPGWLASQADILAEDWIVA